MSTKQSEQLFELLLGRSILFDGDRYRLVKTLGGGATATVFLGADPGEPENESKWVAVKVAKAEEQWQTALTKEWRNLRTLADAETSQGTRYFPRVVHPARDGSNLQQEIFVGDRWLNFLALTQELVPGIGVHDLLLNYPPGLRLPEPLALEIGRQYAEMLTILHRAELTCADRKLADLRWQKRYDFRAGETADLIRWREVPAGSLMVLDWNVTEQATTGPHGTIALDLFRFGILWHRMLLGVEPRFRRGTGWQLEEPLEKHPAWPRLSFGTRRILSRLLYPVPEERYLQAQALLVDLEQQVDWWKIEGTGLAGIFTLVSERYVRSADHPEEAPTQSEAKTAFAAADVLRIRIEEWSEEKQPNFEKIHRSLYRLVREAPFRNLQEAMTSARWETVQQEIKQLQSKYGHDPARLLHMDRHLQIAIQADKARSAWEEVKSLFDRSDLIFSFDHPNGAASQDALNDEHAQAWEKDAETEGEEGAKAIKARHVLEAKYRLELIKARNLKESGSYRAANEVYRLVASLREDIQKHERSLVTWLDLLYADPIPEYKSVAEIVQAGQNLESAFERGLRSLVEESPMLVEAGEGITAVLRVAPDNLFLACLYHLLEIAEAYRHAANRENLLLEIHYLSLVSRRWHGLKNVPEVLVEANSHETALFEKILADYSWRVNEYLDENQWPLKARVLQFLSLEPHLSISPLEQKRGRQRVNDDNIWFGQLTLEAYEQSFPEDKNFIAVLHKKLADCKNQIGSLLSKPVSPLSFDDKLRDLVIALAHQGEYLAGFLQDEWPGELSPERLAEELEDMRKSILKNKLQAAGCREMLFGWRKGGSHS